MSMKPGWTTRGWYPAGDHASHWVEDEKGHKVGAIGTHSSHLSLMCAIERYEKGVAKVEIILPPCDYHA